MFAIGTYEWRQKKWAKNIAKCPKCKKYHNIIWSTVKDSNGNVYQTKTIGAVRCKGKTYLVAIKGKLL
jgi:hypothetical protein